MDAKPKTILSRLLKGIMFFLILLTVLVLAAWFYLSSNSPYVIRKLKEQVKENWGLDLALERYSITAPGGFPLFKLEVEGLALSKNSQANLPFLKLSKAKIPINLYTIIAGDYNLQEIELDSLWLHIDHDTIHIKNADQKESVVQTNSISAFKKIRKPPDLKIKYLDFFHEKNTQKEWQKFQLSDASITCSQNNQQELQISIDGNCHFDGLLFNAKDGAYLSDATGHLSINTILNTASKKIEVSKGLLSVKEDEYLFDGFFQKSDTNHLSLNISTERVLMDSVLPLLSNSVRKAISEIKINKPIQASFSFDKKLDPSKRGSIHVDFLTTNTNIFFRDVAYHTANLIGYYSNQCNKEESPGKYNSCIDIQQLDGRLFNIIPAELNGKVRRLYDPIVSANGRVDILFPSLNQMLASNDKVTFKAGKANVIFDYEGELNKVITAPFDERFARLTGNADFKNLEIKLDDRIASFPSLSGSLTFDEKSTVINDIYLKWMESNVHLSGRISNLPEFIFYKNQAFQSDLSLQFDELDISRFDQQASLSALQSDNTEQSQNPTPETISVKWLEDASRKIASNINGQVHLSIQKLIVDTLFAESVNTKFKFYSPKLPAYKDSMLIEMDSLTFDFMGNSPVAINVALSNDSISKLIVKTKIPSTVNIATIWMPKTIKIKNGDAGLILKAGIPLRYLQQKDSILKNTTYEGELILKQLETSTKALDLPIKEMTGTIAFNNNAVEFDGLNFIYKNAPFTLNGKVENYDFFNPVKKEKAKVDLYLTGHRIDLRKKLSLSNEKQTKTPSKNDKSKINPASIFQSLDTIYKIATGDIELNIDTLLFPDQTIHSIYVQAGLTSDAANLQQHQVTLDSFNFKFGTDNLVMGHAVISAPDNPTLAAELNAKMLINEMSWLLPSQYIEMRDGYLNLSAIYNTQLHDTPDANHYFLQSSIQGDAEIINGNLFYNYRDFNFDDIYAHMTFDQQSLYLRDLDLKINDNRVIANGECRSFFPFFILPDQKAHFDLDVASPYFDFGQFSSPYRLGKAEKELISATIKEVKGKEIADTSKSALELTANFIDLLLSKGSINMNTDFTTIKYEEFNANSITGNISFRPDTVELRDIQMSVANGGFFMNGSLTGVSVHQPSINISTQTENNDIREIFRQFNNFEQENLVYQNLEGKVTSNIEFSADLDADYAFKPGTMNGFMDLKIGSGQLLNIDALSNLSGFLFNKRQLDSILIDTIETYTKIMGTTLGITKFRLHSSSFDFDVIGQYNTESYDNTRLLFTVPLSNLFRRHISAEQLASENSRRKGLNVLIDGRYRKEKMRFRLKFPFFGMRKKYLEFE